MLPIWNWIIFASVFALTLTGALFFRKKSLHASLWIISAGLSISFMLGILFIWDYAINYPDEQENGIPIYSAGDLQSLLDSYAPEEAAHGKMIFIPTGVFIQSIEFSNSNDVYVTGYIWQKYSQGIPKSIERGFTFPEGKDTKISDAYTMQQTIPDSSTNVDVVGYYFETTLRETFGYNHYPLDHQDIWLRIWPQDMDKNVILVPDIESYASLAPDTLPGLEQDFVLEDWDIRESYFSYRLNKYNTNFGLKQATNLGSTPEFYINIHVVRNTINALLAYVAPPLITALMIFGILLLSVRRKEHNISAGWDSATALGFCASLLFVIIFAQISMRNQLNTPGIIYLEYLYFIVYAAILLVSLNSIVIVYYDDLLPPQWEENLIPQILYWPLMTGSFFLITLVMFL